MAMAFSSEAAMATTTTAVTTTVRQQLFNKPKKNPNTSSSLVPIPSILQVKLSRHGKFISALSSVVAKASSSSKNESIVEADAEDGVQLGTMKLPANIDIPRFEILLFQWANSLCQGANLPLPMPLKVDKISGGARLGFIEIGDAKTETPVYIDCLVFPGTETSAPIFRAIRNGRTKDRSPPGEPRIMRSLQEALKKSVQIASA